MARKYQATRIKAGDYIQASNSAEWIYRITSTDIDGKTEWSVHRYFIPVSEMPEDLPRNFLDWHRWQYVTSYTTKRAAIEAVVE